MTEAEAETFVASFAAARAAGRGEHLWSREGRLHHPYASRVISGDEMGALNDLMARQAPDLTWELAGWTHRGEIIVVEWLCTNRYRDVTVSFAGMDKLTIKDGQIVEEIVYADTAPLQAMRQGRAFEALIQLPARELA